MIRFILITFGFLGFAFYEMSGGADFDPQMARLTDIRTDPLKPAANEDADSEVTRVALNLTSVTEVLAEKPKPSVTKPTGETAQIVKAVATTITEEPAVILPSLITGVDPIITEDPQPEAQAEDTTVPLLVEIRTVAKTRVNVRGGPGTDYGVVDKLQLGDAVEVLEDNGSGWVRMRPLDGGPTGWMADFLLSEG